MINCLHLRTPYKKIKLIIEDVIGFSFISDIHDGELTRYWNMLEYKNIILKFIILQSVEN